MRLVADLVALCAAAAIAQRWATEPISAGWLLLVSLAILLASASSGHYMLRPRLRLADELRAVLMLPAVVATSAAAAQMLAGAGAGAGDAAARAWLIIVPCFAVGRLLVHTIERHRKRPGGARHTTLILGAGDIGQMTAERLRSRRDLDLEPVGFLDDAPEARPDRTTIRSGGALPVLGAIRDLERVVGDHGVEQVVIGFSSARDERLVDVVRRCWSMRLPVKVVPRLFEVHTAVAQVDHLGGIPLVSLAPPDLERRQLRAKYAADRVVACLAMVALAPVFAIIAAGIRLTMGGPVLFRQRRVGENGRVFEMLKFRTMVSSAAFAGEADLGWASLVLGQSPERDEPDPVSAVVDRCTSLGAFLRRIGLDELPQLLNVLRGEMSLIGPRPERVQYVERFTDAVYRYGDRHRIRGGLTGWAQVNGLRGETSLRDRVECDNFYIENWNLWLDLRILWRTLPAIFRHAVAHESTADAEPIAAPLLDGPFVATAGIEDADGRSQAAVARSQAAVASS